MNDSDDSTEEEFRPVPSELVQEFGRAAADNAMQLVEEADLLDEHGHLARAFALTVLAAEELGKAAICLMSENARTLDDWQAFGAMVIGPRKHQTKLLGALFLIQKAAELSGDASSPYQLAQELSDLTDRDLTDAKMAALYVDLEGGAIVTPTRVTEHLGAQQRARALRREVSIWAMLLGGEPAEADS